MSDQDNGLPAYLKVKGPTMKSFYDAALAANKDEDVIKRVTSKTVVEGRSGIRRITIRNHQIIADSPPAWCGYDLGASAPEILLGALTACISHMYLVVGGIQNVKFLSLEVEASGSLDLRRGSEGHEDKIPGIQNIAYTVFISSDETKQTLEELHALVEKICPLYVC